jgi:hypothetical protein
MLQMHAKCALEGIFLYGWVSLEANKEDKR